MISARGVGLAQGAPDLALDDAKQRFAHGQRIGDFQGIQFRLTDMAMQIDADRQLDDWSAGSADRRSARKDVAASVANAKCFASDAAQQVAIDACWIFGSYGCPTDYPVERFLRAARLPLVVEGTNQIQRIIIAKSLLEA